MKLKNIFAFLLLLVAGLQSVKAQEAYACMVQTSESPISYTLIFYYDNQRSSRTGTTYNIPASNHSTPSWLSNQYKAWIRNVVFNPTFANVRPISTYCWFKEFVRLENITGMEYLNTSAVINMSEMFNFCQSMTSLDLSNFNTANVTDMSYMFYGCRALT